MSKVVHGGNIDELSRKYKLDKDKLIDFSANINPIGINENVKKEMIKALEYVERYPDITYYDLKLSISNFENINIEEVVLGNGAAEIIFNLVRALRPKKVILPAPTFGEYEEAILSVNGDIDYYILREDTNWNISEDILNYIKEDIDMIFLCNPNNPTGALTSKNLIRSIARKALETNTTVVIDESFLDFVKSSNEYTALNLLDEYENIFIVKSMTKFFAMPGIRIGYGISRNKEILSMIDDVSVPWNVNVVAEKSAIVALKEEEYIKETIDYIEKEKTYLFNELRNINKIKVFTPSVNFIMFKTIEGIDLKEAMLKEGVIIRSCSNYKGLNDNYYRIAVRTRKENQKLVSVLKRIVK